MMSEGKDCNKSQFIFTLGPCRELDKQHTIFGTIVGSSSFNLPKFNELVRFENTETPMKPPVIISTQVVLNPFPSLLPRQIVQNEPTTVVLPSSSTIGSKLKVTKKASALLSFDDEEEDGDDKDHMKRRKVFTGKALLSVASPTLNSSKQRIAGESDDAELITRRERDEKKVEILREHERTKQIALEREMVDQQLVTVQTQTLQSEHLRSFKAPDSMASAISLSSRFSTNEDDEEEEMRDMSAEHISRSGINNVDADIMKSFQSVKLGKSAKRVAASSQSSPSDKISALRQEKELLLKKLRLAFEARKGRQIDTVSENEGDIFSTIDSDKIRLAAIDKSIAQLETVEKLRGNFTKLSDVKALSQEERESKTRSKVSSFLSRLRQKNVNGSEGKTNLVKNNNGEKGVEEEETSLDNWFHQSFVTKRSDEKDGHGENGDESNGEKNDKDESRKRPNNSPSSYSDKDRSDRYYSEKKRKSSRERRFSRESDYDRSDRSRRDRERRSSREFRDDRSREKNKEKYRD